MNGLEIGQGARATIVAAATEMDGHCAVVINELESGLSGPPLHRHTGFGETFVVLAGRLELRRGEDLLELGPGDVAVVPPGVVHCFRSSGEEAARWVNVYAPGGIERWFADAADLLPRDGAPDPAAMARLAVRYGLERVDGD